MATFQIEHNVPEVLTTLRGFQKNLAYGMSQALNGTVLFAQKAVRASMPSQFHIRNQYVQRGVQVRLASKTNLEARIGHPLDFMRLQELGGEKDKAGRDMAVPIGPGGASPAFRGPNLMGTTLRGRWPSNLYRVFIIRSKATGTPLVIQRRGKRTTRVIYTLHAEVRIKARWNLVGQVRQVADVVLPKLLPLELLAALRKAR